MLLEPFIIGAILTALIEPMNLLFTKKIFDLDIKGASAIGLGITTGNVIYALFGGLGFKLLGLILQRYTAYLHVLGGTYLIYLGIKEANTRTLLNVITPMNSIAMPFILFFFALISTLSKPQMILAFLGLFSLLGCVDVIPIAFDVFCGSLCWWIFLGIIILILKQKLTPFWIRIIRITSAASLIALGAHALSR